MARKKRKLEEINASSMADIAFLLLVFFLVTTTMDTDWGVVRKLPPPLDINDPDPPKFKERNIFTVLVNTNDQLLVEGEWGDIATLRARAKEFIANPARKDNLPELVEVSVGICQQEMAQAQAAGNAEEYKKWEKKLETAKVLGSYSESKQVISLQNDRGTSYEMYVKVQNELAAAYRELRDELGQKKFGVGLDNLTNEQYEAVKNVYPQRISEAEPKNVGGNK